MHLESPRVIGLLASGLLLAGWLLGSTLSPPVAQTQSRDAPRPAPAPRPLPAIEPLRNLAAQRHHAWARRRQPATRSRSAGPSRRTRNASDMAPDVPAAESTVVEIPAPPPAPAWRLLGVAVGTYGEVTAVMSGAGDVHLVQAGDTLPGDLLVIDVTATGARLQRPDGSVIDADPALNAALARLAVRAQRFAAEAGATALVTRPSLRKSRTARTVSTPTRSCASRVEAAMCGVATTAGCFASAQCTGGSGSNTSSAAPATWPDSQRRQQRRFVDQIAARRVDQAHAAPAPAPGAARRTGNACPAWTAGGG